jgi:integrase
MLRKQCEIPWLEIRDGVYCVWWYDEATKRTKRINLRTGDRVEAQAAYAAFLAQGPQIFAPSDGLSVGRALDDYLREHVHRQCVAVARQAIGIRHLKTWFGATMLRDIDVPSCLAYFDHRTSESIAAATIRRELNILAAAARHAAKRKRIPLTEMPTFEMPAEPPAKMEWLARDELDRLLAAAEGKLRDFIVIAYYTAGRRDSVERLTKSQIDLRNSRINLTHPDETALQRRSKKRRPVVPIDPLMRPTLERRMLETEGEALFGNTEFYRPFMRLMRQLGLKGSPHVLRHSRATHLLQAGVSIYNVARLLGDTMATVERVYGHHSADYLGEAIRRVG